MSTNSDISKTGSKPVSSLLAAIGPGILFAAVAVGVSHLVHATRAGATYGLGMLSIIIIACLIKYPAIRFGAEYTAATGESLIQSYRRRGLWAIYLYGFAQIFSMFFVVAAVSLVTIGLLKSVFGLEISNLLMVASLLTVAVITLISGRYHLLEKITKMIVPAFTVLILIAVAMVIGKIEWSFSKLAWPEFTTQTIMFIVALAGFMPAPLDSSVLQSLWTKAKADEVGYLPTPTEALFDFNVGFITTLLLALCFTVLGAGVMFGSDVPLAAGAGGFATQVLDIFTTTIGQWSYPIISAAAIAVMLSTVLTVLDGYPRAVEALIQEVSPRHGEKLLGFKTYDLIIILLAIGAFTVLAVFMSSFAAFIDLTSVIVFVLGPILAYLNHKAIFGEEMPTAKQPGFVIKAWSILGGITMFLFGILYFYLRLFHS